MSAVASPRPSAADKRILVRPSAEVQAVEAELARLAAGSGRIVVGPWEGGVTEELLYWLPFLRWAQERFGLNRSRLIAVSRSGVGAWYDAVCAGYAESVPEGIERLTPELARRVYEPYREGRRPVQELLERLRFERLAAPDPPDGEVVAVGFEPTEAFPDTPDNRELAARVTERLRASADVVDVGDGAGPADSAAAIGRARAFVGSYGDLAHVGLALGVPTIAVYSELRALPATELDIAHRASLRLGTAFTLLDARWVDLVGELAGAHA